MEFTENFRIWIYGPRMANVLSKEVLESEYEDIPRLRDYMLKMMKTADGVGLAAPQIGCFKRYIVVEDNGHIVDLVNPYITQMYGKEIEDHESCLSLPPQGNSTLVPRLETIHVEASTGNVPHVRREFIFTHYPARIVQHEVDHLDGTFFVDRVPLARKKDVIDRFDWWKRKKQSQMRYAREGSRNVDAGIVAARGAKSRLS